MANEDENVNDNGVAVNDGQEVQNNEDLVPNNMPQSDPKGVDSEGGVTTNPEGDEPGSEREVFERENGPAEIEQAKKDGTYPD